MGADGILLVGAIGLLAVAVCVGPVLLVVRAGLRLALTPTQMRRWQGAARCGVSSGLVAACIICGLLIGASASALAAVLSILALLATMDLAWRWLPLEWTLPLIALAVGLAARDGNLGDAAIGLAIGAGTLWVLQSVFRIWRGIDALGTGDIWLAAGLGALAGPYQISWILCFAAVSALGVVVVMRALPPSNRRHRVGVAYGAHQCFAYLFFYCFIGF